MNSRTLSGSKPRVLWIGLLVTLMLGAVLAASLWQPVFGAAPVQQAQGGAISSNELYSELLQGVVSIEVVRDTPFGPMEMPEDMPDPKSLFPGREFPTPQNRGTGFVFDAQGHIVTNQHVVDSATAVHVVFSDGSWYPATVLGEDPFSDLAVLEIEDLDREVAPLPLAEAGTLQVGHTVYAFGYPSGLTGALTRGMISSIEPGGMGFGASGYPIPNLIYSDTLVVPGYSGGPLLNEAGEVTGVNTGIAYTGIGTQGLTLSIPLDVVRKIVPSLIADQTYTYPHLGIRGGSITAVQAAELALPRVNIGALVHAVQEGSAAATGGIQAGDILIAIGENPITNFGSLASQLVLNYQAGDRVEFSALRDGEEINFQVELGTRTSPLQ